ncbi:hypothetical protein D030_0158B, partial [Vibrio parahaemolyticus AQ3810]|jgi:hypothetical protein
LTR